MRGTWERRTVRSGTLSEQHKGQGGEELPERTRQPIRHSFNLHSGYLIALWSPRLCCLLEKPICSCGCGSALVHTYNPSGWNTDVPLVPVLSSQTMKDRVSLCNLDCPGTHSADQTDLEIGESPASASGVLELKAWATPPGFKQKWMQSDLWTVLGQRNPQSNHWLHH